MERKSEGRFSVCGETLQKACNYLWNVNLREGSVFVWTCVAVNNVTVRKRSVGIVHIYVYQSDPSVLGSVDIERKRKCL